MDGKAYSLEEFPNRDQADLMLDRELSQQIDAATADERCSLIDQQLELRSVYNQRHMDHAERIGLGPRIHQAGKSLGRAVFGRVLHP